MLDKKPERVKIQPYCSVETAEIIDILAKESGHFPGVVIDQIVAVYGRDWIKKMKEQHGSQ